MQVRASASSVHAKGVCGGVCGAPCVLVLYGVCGVRVGMHAYARTFEIRYSSIRILQIILDVIQVIVPLYLYNLVVCCFCCCGRCCCVVVRRGFHFFAFLATALSVHVSVHVSARYAEFVKAR